MPNKDGLQVIKDIREFEKKNNVTDSHKVRILMTTSLQETNIVSQVIESGCDGYLAKPIILDKLLAQLRIFGLIK